MKLLINIRNHNVGTDVLCYVKTQMRKCTPTVGNAILIQKKNIYTKILYIANDATNNFMLAELAENGLETQLTIMTPTQ